MKTKVLIVDDDQQTCELIKTILVAAGMDAVFLTDSRAAAARLHTEKMDLLFLDLHMPKHGGFDLLNSIRGSGVNRRTPVVMITGDQDPKLLARGFEAGANYFLFKPIELNKLMRLVRASETAVYRERRRFQRVSVSRRALVAAKGERVEGSTLDLSLGGMMFRGDRTLQVETRVDAEIHFGAGRKLDWANHTKEADVWPTPPLPRLWKVMKEVRLCEPPVRRWILEVFSRQSICVVLDRHHRNHGSDCSRRNPSRPAGIADHSSLSQGEVSVLMGEFICLGHYLPKESLPGFVCTLRGARRRKCERG